MASPTELERDLVRLRADLERYKAASEAALEDLAWVIGYLEHNQRTGLARDLRRNRAAIRRALRQGTRHG